MIQMESDCLPIILMRMEDVAIDRKTDMLAKLSMKAAVAVFFPLLIHLGGTYVSIQFCCTLFYQQMCGMGNLVSCVYVKKLCLVILNITSAS